MDEGEPEQLISRRPLLRLHEDPLQELPAVVRHVSGKHGVGGLSGDLKDGRHGFELGPGGSLGQHLHHRAANAPSNDSKQRHFCCETASSPGVHPRGSHNTEYLCFTTPKINHRDP